MDKNLPSEANNENASFQNKGILKEKKNERG